MKKKTKEIIETTTLAVGVILLSAAAFYSSKETGKTELKTDRKEQITSEQETKEAYEAAQKELSFWYSDADCRNYFEQCAVDYYAKTGIAVGIRYVDEESYLEQIYDATMTEEDYPDLYLAWNDAKDKAYLYGVATEEEYPLFFDTLVMVYQKENDIFLVSMPAPDISLANRRSYKTVFYQLPFPKKNLFLYFLGYISEQQKNSIPSQ